MVALTQNPDEDEDVADKDGGSHVLIKMTADPNPHLLPLVTGRKKGKIQKRKEKKRKKLKLKEERRKKILLVC